MKNTENEAESISKRCLTPDESAIFFEYNFCRSVDVRSAHPRR